MKKIALIVAMLFVTTYASAGLRDKIHLGLKAGLGYQANEVKLANITDFSLSSNAGWFAGAAVDIELPKKFSIQPEAVFSHYKFNIENAIDGYMKVNQIEIPVMVGYDLTKMLKVQVGPRFCVMEDVNGVAENAAEFVEGVTSAWNWNSPILGYALGLEANIWKIVITARYNGEFKKAEVLGFPAGGTNRISNFQLGVGYFF